jgi:hypothetical protein
LIHDSTASERDPTRICTGITRSTIKGDHERFRDAYEEKSDDRIDDDIFSSFCSFFASSCGHHDIEGIDSHREKSKGRKQEECVHDRFEDIVPDEPADTTVDEVTGIVRSAEIESAPYRVGDLHHDDPERDPEDISPPFFDTFFFSSTKEELQDTDDEKYNRDEDEEIFQGSCDGDEGIFYCITSEDRRVEKIQHWSHKCREIAIYRRVHLHIIYISQIDIFDREDREREGEEEEGEENFHKRNEDDIRDYFTEREIKSNISIFRRFIKL